MCCAVVNAANSSLLGGGGVDGAIHRKGGPEILEACRRIRRESYPKGLPAGGAVVTPAGALPCRYVIHTVGPVWKGGTADEPDLLAAAYGESLKRASELKIESVAFPAISTGVYGYPKERAAITAYDTSTAFLETHDKPSTVYMVFFSEENAQTFLCCVRSEG